MIEIRRNLGVNIFSTGLDAYNEWDSVSARDRDDYPVTYIFNERIYNVLDVKEHYESFNSLVRLRNLALAILVTIFSVGFALAHPIVRQWFTGRQVAVILQERNNLPPPDFHPHGPDQPQDFDGEKDVIIADLREGRLHLRENYEGCRARLEPFSGDRDVALVAVLQDGRFLRIFNDAIKDDRDIVMAAVGQTGYALYFASQRLKNDRQIVMAAVQQQGLALENVGGDPLLGGSFKDDEEVVLAAVNQNGNARRYASMALRDQENVKHAAREQLRAGKIAHIQGYPETTTSLQIRIFELQDELFNDDEQVMFEIMQRWPTALQYAGPICRNNKAMVLQLVQQDGVALQYVSDALKNDGDVVLMAVRQSSGLALQHASERLQGDQHIVLAAVQQNGCALQYAGNELKQDEAIVLAAVQQDGFALVFADANLKENERIVLAAVRQNGLALEFADADLKGNEDIVSVAVRQNGLALEFADADLKGNEDIVSMAVRQNGLALQFANADLNENENIVLEAVQQDLNGRAFRYAGLNLRGNKELVLRIIGEGKGAILKHVSPELKSDKEFVLAAVKECSGALQHVNRELQHDKDVLLAAFCSCCRNDQEQFNYWYIRNQNIEVAPGERRIFATLQQFKNYFLSRGEIRPAPSLGDERYALVPLEVYTETT